MENICFFIQSYFSGNEAEYGQGGMGEIIYDLPEEGRDEYMEWYHEVHIPKNLLVRLPWAAHYEVQHPGERFEKIAARLNRTERSCSRVGVRDLSRFSAGIHQEFSTTPALRS